MKRPMNARAVAVRRRPVAVVAATATVAVTLAAPVPAPRAAARPRPAPLRRSVSHSFPHGYRGTAISGRAEGVPARRGDVLGALDGARRLAPSGARAAAAGAHTVTVDVLDRHGGTPRTADAQAVIFTSPADGTSRYGDLSDGRFTGQVPAGDYIVETGVFTMEASGEKSLTVVYLPRVVIDRDRTVVLDARRGRAASVSVADRADARLARSNGGAGYGRIVQKVGGKITTTANFSLKWPVYVTPTGRAPGLRLLLQGRLTKDGAEDGSPYIYNVAGAVPAREAIPADPALSVRTADLAAVRTRYADQGRPGCAGTHAGARWPGGGFNELFYVGVGALPATRMEYFSPGADWDTDTGVTSADCAFAQVSTAGADESFPRAGAYERDRTAGPLGPGADYAGVGHDGAVQFWVPMYSSWAGRSGIAPYDGVTGRTTLEKVDGGVIGTSDQPGYGEFRIPPGRATYRATTEARREVPWSGLAVRQHVVWTFTTDRPSGDWSPLPLLSVLYRLPLDEHNRARRGTQRVELSVRNGDDAPVRTIRRPVLQISYDDGRTWADAPVRATGDGWTATVRNPGGQGPGYVSLRAVAQDADGNGVDQTVVHAYGLR